MYYARWCKDKEMKSTLKKIDVKKEITETGTPIAYEGNDLYLSNKGAHSLIIGATGSGKTQTTILPITKLSMLAGESIIINDVKGEIYNLTAANFKEKGYEVIVLNFDNPSLGNSWNPLILGYEFYQSNQHDKAISLIEDLGYYLFTDTKETGDPFWTNSTIDFFTGLILYLFENAKKEEINLNSVYNLANNLTEEKKIKDFLNKLDKNSIIYYNLSGTLTSPPETRGGILSTFNQKIKKYIGLNNLSEMLSISNFDLKTIPNKKTAIFIIDGITTFGNVLIPLFISQMIVAVDIFGDKKRNLNIVLDEFDSMLPIKNFAKIINYSRSINIRFAVVIRGYMDLINIYGKESTEIIKTCFPIIIYLLSSDIYTLEEISKMCGNCENNKQIKPLITIEELKVMKTFEAIVLMPRMMPYKTKLLPDYKINWNLEEKKLSIPERKKTKINIYDIYK